MTFAIFSAGYGMGHHQAARAIAEALARRYPEDPVEVIDFLTLLPPAMARNTLRVHHWLTRKWPWGYGAMYAITGRLAAVPGWHRLEERPGRKALAQWIEGNSPRALIATHPMPLMGLAALKRQGVVRGPVVGVITDYVAHPSWINAPVDGYAVANAAVGEKIRARIGAAATVAVTGIPLRAAFASPPSSQAVRQRWQWDARPRVLVNLGSYGMTARKALSLAGALDALTPGAVLVWLTGRDASLYQTLAQEAGRHPAWLVLPYQQNMEEWIAAADAVLTPAGALTLTEAAALRRPVLIYQPRPGQEFGNAEWFRQHGAALVAETPEAARDGLHELLTNAVLVQGMAQRMAELVPRNAAERVAQLVTDLLETRETGAGTSERG
ncbi:MAG: glycosyltransferase [Firmicutes bacterium]|nr:glycosyltransferase [Bacillota bacterium]